MASASVPGHTHPHLPLPWPQDPRLSNADEDNSIVTALAHNTLAFAQVFNLVKCRRVDDNLNIFEDVVGNRTPIVITLIGTSPAFEFQNIDTDDDL